MQTLSLSSTRPFSLHKTHIPSLNEARVLHVTQHSSFVHFNPLRALSNSKEIMLTKRRKELGPVCYAASLTPGNLQWISTISIMVLMFAKGSAIKKSFLFPLFALQAPPSIISWIKGEYGIWTAFLALLVRLFFFIPGELELPLVVLILVIVAPYLAMNLRGTQEGAILSLEIAGYLAFPVDWQLGKGIQPRFCCCHLSPHLYICCAVLAFDLTSMCNRRNICAILCKLLYSVKNTRLENG